MDIIVLVKHVPDTWSERTLKPGDWTTDRESADAGIDEIDSRAVETALLLVQEHGGEVTVVTMGGDGADESLRKALAMGAHKAIHIHDDALAGSCALQTSAALAAVIRSQPPDLVITGNESTDGATGLLSSMLAERLGWPQLPSVRELRVADGTATAERVNGAGHSEISAALPAVVSVTEKINDPRYPTFKGIMAAKKKPLSTVGSRELGLDPRSIGLPNASVAVLEATARPARAAGVKIHDDGSAAAGVARFLTAARLI